MLIPLSLKRGENRVRFTDATACLEPTSVILRDPSGKHVLRIFEQNYRSHSVSRQLRLPLDEGKPLDFAVPSGDPTAIVQGKILRSRCLPNPPQAWNPYDRGQASPLSLEPIVEVEGKLRRGLPGTPLLPTLPDDPLLKPALDWGLETDEAPKVIAEFS